MPENIDPIAGALDATSKVLEQLPIKDIYQDALQPGVRQLGKFVETAGMLVNYIVAPMRQMFLAENLLELESELQFAFSRKMITAPLVPPKPSVTFPAVQGFCLTEGEPELRRMYVELLASSMDPATATTAHPSFVNAIAQISSDEAKILKFLFHSGPQPIVGFGSPNVYLFESRLNSFIAQNAQCQFPEQIDFYLDNLERLAIISPPELSIEPILNENPWVSIINSNDHQDQMSHIRNKYPTIELVSQGGYLKLSVYGMQLCDACIAKITP